MARCSGDLVPPSPREEVNAGKHETRQSSTGPLQETPQPPPPAPITAAYRYAPDPISKRKKKIQKSDFLGFLFFPLLSICLDGSKPAQTVKKMMFDGES